MFSISVCMIVKNEELVLDRILTCAKKIADEIIIVDTGSTDKTKEIAKKYTNNVYDFVWCNDFAKARNFSFSLATKDYLMWLDADDYITDKNMEKINNLKKSNNNIDVYMFKYVMGFVDNQPTFEFFRERLLRREKNFQWEGFVHEAITPCGKIQNVDIEIEHRKIKENPPKRNLKLYHFALKQGRIFNAREQYYYSRELYYNGYYKKAITQLKKYLKLNDSYKPNIIGAYILICESYLQINNYNQALKFALTAISKFIPTPELCCLAARIFEAKNQTYQSIFWYNIALFAPLPTEGFIQKDFKDFIPYLELCRIYYSIDKEISKSYYLQAKVLHPTHPSIKYNAKFFE